MRLWSVVVTQPASSGADSHTRARRCSKVVVALSGRSLTGRRPSLQSAGRCQVGCPTSAESELDVRAVLEDVGITKDVDEPRIVRNDDAGDADLFAGGPQIVPLRPARRQRDTRPAFHLGVANLRVRHGARERLRVAARDEDRGGRVQGGRREDEPAARQPLERRASALAALPVQGDEPHAVRISAEADDEAGHDAPRPPFAIDTDLVESNQVDVHLRGAAGRRPERSFLSSSACGVCGATTVESLALDFAPLGGGPVIDARVLTTLGGRLREQQRLFESTGGLHAAGLFDEHGELQLLREDVGRHNAVDKVVGRSLIEGRLPLRDRILAVSGRGGYELVQKAVAAGIPIMAAVGAPSSLAVATARRFRMTLVGFLRDDRFNVYSGAERLS